MASSFVVLQKPIQFLDDASEALFRRLGRLRWSDRRGLRERVKPGDFQVPLGSVSPLNRVE